MTLMEVNIDDPIELREFTASSIVEASDYSTKVAGLIRAARSKAQATARQTLDTAFLDLRDANAKRERKLALDKFASLLRGVETDARAHTEKFYDLRLEMDQGLGFYLMHASRDDLADIREIEELVRQITDARDGNTNAIATTDTLIKGIKASAGAVPELAGLVDDAVRALKNIRDELDIGEAVLTRHIQMATHLRNLIAHGQR